MDDWLCVKRNFANLPENTDFLADNHLINLRVSQMELVSIALSDAEGRGLCKTQKLLDNL